MTRIKLEKEPVTDLETGLGEGALHDLTTGRALLPQIRLPRASLEGGELERFLLVLGDHVFRAIRMLSRKPTGFRQANIVNFVILALQPTQSLLVYVGERGALDLF